MAKNNWANEAFRKAQSLMSRGYDDFEPTTVVTQDQLSDLGDAITTSRPSMVGPNQLDEHMLSPWSLNHEEAKTQAFQDEADITGDIYEGPVDINNQPLNTDNFDIEAPYGPLDPHDHPKKPEATSRISRILNKYLNEPLGELNAWLNPDTEEKRTTYKFDKALEKIEDEITETYTVFDSKTPLEQKQEKDKVFELEQDRRRILEQKKAWEKRDTPGDEQVKEDSSKAWYNNIDFISEAGAATTGSVHNNPGNIENSSIKWNGQRQGAGYGPKGNENRFASFETPEAGIRAMTMDITSKFKEFNGDLKKMIDKYAPDSENDVKKYLQVVQKTAGKKYRYTEEDIPNIVKGFIRMENKKELADYYIKLMEK